MCVAIGKKLLMFQWKHSAAWTAWCPASDTDTIEGFSFFWVSNNIKHLGFSFSYKNKTVGAQFKRNSFHFNRVGERLESYFSYAWRCLSLCGL